MHWVLQTETALTSSTAPPASVAGNVQIDWVAAWAYDPQVSTLSTTSDTTAPTVKLGALPGTASGTVPISATASDASGISQVKWYVDGVEVAWDGTGSTWSDSWYTKQTPNGYHRMMAKARDKAGNWGTSESVTVKVAN